MRSSIALERKSRVKRRMRRAHAYHLPVSTHNSRHPYPYTDLWDSRTGIPCASQVKFGFGRPSLRATRIFRVIWVVRVVRVVRGVRAVGVIRVI